MEITNFKECLSAVRACINFVGAYQEKGVGDPNALGDALLALEDLEDAGSLLEDLAAAEERDGGTP